MWDSYRSKWSTKGGDSHQLKSEAKLLILNGRHGADCQTSRKKKGMLETGRTCQRLPGQLRTVNVLSPSSSLQTLIYREMQSLQTQTYSVRGIAISLKIQRLKQNLKHFPTGGSQIKLTHNGNIKFEFQSHIPTCNQDNTHYFTALLLGSPFKGIPFAHLLYTVHRVGEKLWSPVIKKIL